MNIKQIIEEFCEQAEKSLHSSYSGRGMFGSTCYGISGEGSGAGLVADLIQYAAEILEDKEEILEFIDEISSNLREDSMGRGIIVYFPNISK